MLLIPSTYVNRQWKFNKRELETGQAPATATDKIAHPLTGAREADVQEHHMSGYPVNKFC
jgi:hypothetical protein